jgi:hypothetical protein
MGTFSWPWTGVAQPKSVTVLGNVGHRPALHHFLDLPTDTPGPARRLAEHLSNIVRAATAGDAGTTWESALPCRRRPANRRCPGQMIVLRTEPQTPIRWKCSDCGDEGVISNWEESPFDLRRQRLALAGPVHEIVIGAEVAATLRELQFLDTDCERMIFAIRAHNDGAILAATDDDLDELIGYVAARQTMSPTDAVNSGSTPHSARSTPQPRHQTAGDSMALPELDVAGVQRWCAARVPEHARHQVRVECEVAHDTSRSSSGVPPGARTSGPNGPPFRSLACVTPPPTGP